MIGIDPLVKLACDREAGDGSGDTEQEAKDHHRKRCTSLVVV
jgi:hypothetical protein